MFVRVDLVKIRIYDSLEEMVTNAMKEAKKMKIDLKNCLFATILTVFGYASSAGGIVGDPKKLEALESYGKIPLYFIKNKDCRAKFVPG